MIQPLKIPETYTTISIDLSAGQSDLTWYAGFVKSSTTVVVPPESNNSGGGIKEAPILGGLSNTGINILLGLLSLAVITGAIFTARKRSNSNRQYRLH